VRTTIELKPEHRAALLELAARRGEKGFSSLIADAIEAYLAGAERRLSKRALKLRGVLPASEADRLRHHAARIREQWR